MCEPAGTKAIGNTTRLWFDDQAHSEEANPGRLSTELHKKLEPIALVDRALSVSESKAIRILLPSFDN